MHDGLMKPLRVLLPLLLLALVGLGLSGCSTTTVQKAAMVVSLLDIQVGAGNEAVLQLRLQSEEIEPIAVAGTTHRVMFNGQSYGEAVNTKPMAVPARGDVRFTAKLVLGDAAAADRLRALLASGSIEYRLESRLNCEIGEDDRLILKTSSSGRLGAP